MKKKLLILMVVLALSSTGMTQMHDDAVLDVFHSISSHTLYEYVAELSSEKFEGRLTGTLGYDASARWVADKFQEFGVAPMGDDGTYFQWFDIPYTLVFPDCEVSLHIPYGKSSITKSYHYFDEFIPGGTSGSGEITAEVVYVGYGATAPELGYDDYRGVDVEGKIVLMEREVPVSPRDDPELFKKWRPYSFHQYKLENAVKHGARGMLYNYGPIGNPNNAYDAGFIYSHVGEAVVADLFEDTGRDHEDLVNRIKETLRSQSFRMRKTVTIRNTTEHNPEGRGSNVIGIIRGTDPVLREEVIVVGGHLDHLGYGYTMMPGANDNASAVAVILALAEALAKEGIPLKRSILFNCFGAEEQAIVGSKFYLENPSFPLDKTVCLLNMDGVGVGDKLRAIAAENYPDLWDFVDNANASYVHRAVTPTHFHNLARPRLDAARFMWAGVPTISFAAYGAPSAYHNPNDNIDAITPEIMEDLAQLLFLAIVEIANTENVNFREVSKRRDNQGSGPMNVYLVRHGKAKSEEEDARRPLSGSGIAEVEAVAEHIATTWDIHPSRIYHSTKLRAKQTAEIIADALKKTDSLEEAEGLKPLDDPRTWADRIEAMEDDVMLVGHLPYMGKLASYLLVNNPNASTVTFQTATALHLRRDDQGVWSIIGMVNPLIAQKGASRE